MERQRGVRGGKVLYALGELALQTEDLDAARAYYGTFLRDWHETGDPVGISWALRGLAELARAEGEPARAARLMGASMGLETASAALRLEDLHARYQALQGSLRPALREAALEAAWEEGRAMTLGQAVAYAKEPLESIAQDVA